MNSDSSNLENLDFIAIGDITTDEFIRLSPDRAVVNTDLSGRQVLSMYFGDKLEFLNAVNVPAVGNSPNAAVASHRLGLKTGLVTDIGDDEGGREIHAWLEKEGINLSFMRVNAGKTTNHHYVLMYGAERTILIKHEKYEYKLPDISSCSPKWMYFSSVGEHSLDYHHEIAAYLTSHPETKLAFQPGSFQILFGYEKIKDIYAISTLFFCNKEEAKTILGSDESDMTELLKRMQELGPKMPVITDGPNGAYVLADDGVWHMPMYPDPSPPISRTGAGDAFSSTFTCMLAIGKTVPEALARAPINSMAVVQKIGAQAGLLSPDQIEEYLIKAPAEYKAEKIG